MSIIIYVNKSLLKYQSGGFEQNLAESLEVGLDTYAKFWYNGLKLIPPFIKDLAV